MNYILKFVKVNLKRINKKKLNEKKCKQKARNLGDGCYVWKWIKNDWHPHVQSKNVKCFYNESWKAWTTL